MRGVRLTALSGSPRPRRCLTGRWQRLIHTNDKVNFQEIKKEMASRRPKAIYDILSPTQSHLLNISLSDYLPPETYPSHFTMQDLTLPSTRTDVAVPMPQGHHLVYFPPQIPPSQLLPDGTDPDHSPGGAFVRRMWAGGSVRFADGWQEQLRLDGRRALCVESVGDVNITEGRAPGTEKIFVDVWRRYGSVGQEADARDIATVQSSPAIEEKRVLVFMRELVGNDGTTPQVKGPRIVTFPQKAEASVTLTPRHSLLFHFSALTFNAHRIHLDPQYTRDVEGHPNLLVHGPLSLTLLFAGLRAQLQGSESIKSIEYRNLAPLYAEQPLRICIAKRQKDAQADDASRKTWNVWAEGPNGSLAIKGVAST